jgi:hypothetical protein
MRRNVLRANAENNILANGRDPSHELVSLKDSLICTSNSGSRNSGINSLNREP